MDLELNLTTETVDQLRQTAPICVEPATPLRQVLQALKEASSGSVLICRGGAVQGIFTERDALRALALGSDPAGAFDWEQPIEGLMVRQPVTLSANDTVATAIKKMSAGGYRRLPVVDAAGRPLGIVNVSGIVHYLVDHFPKAVYNLPPDPQAVLQKREGP